MTAGSCYLAATSISGWILQPDTIFSVFFATFNGSDVFVEFLPSFLFGGDWEGVGWWHFRALLVILAKRKADRWKGVCSIWIWPTWWTVPSSPSVSLEEPFEREQQTTPKTTGCVYVEEGEKTSTSSDRDFIFPGLDGKNILFRKKPDVFTLLIGWITIRSVAWEMSDSCYWLLLLVAAPSIRLHPTITSLSCDEIYASCLL